MRRLVAALLLGLGLMCAAAPAFAGAAQDPIQDCLNRADPQKTAELGLASCREDENGQLQPYWDEPSTGASFGAVIGGLFVFGLVWSLIPVFASYSIAKNAGQSTGVAILLGLALGWIGLLIVYLMSRSDTRAAMHGAVDAMAPRSWAPPPPAPGVPTPAQDVPARLRALSALRDSGEITDAEYETQRRAIIGTV
jgi:hypothetical protein